MRSIFKMVWWFRTPLRLLVRFILQWVVFYRKKVLLTHHALLSHHLRSQGLELITRTSFLRASYQNLSFLLVEALALPFADKKFLQKHYQFKNPGMLQDRLDQGHSVLLTVSHTGNWEWGALALPLSFTAPVLSAYKPLSNGFWNRTILSLRQRTGTQCLDRTQAPAFLRNQPGPWLFVLIMDQYPHTSERRQFLGFLGQETAVYSGLETLARMSKASILHARCVRTQGFCYEIEFVDLQEQHSASAATEAYFMELQRSLEQHPEQWLWTHKRWKNLPHLYES